MKKNRDINDCVRDIMDLLSSVMEVSNHEAIIHVMVDEKENICAYNDIIIWEGAIFTKVEDKNLLIADFHHPELTIFHRLESPEEEIYLFKCKSEQEEEKQLFLLKSKCKKHSYVSNGLLSIGKTFRTTSRTKQTEYANKLLELLVKDNPKEVWVSDRSGWYKDKNGNIQFCNDEEYTWNSLLKHIY